MRKGINVGPRNGQWKGNKVSKEGIHDYIKPRLPKTDLCQSCKLVPPYDLANISGKYKRALSDWEWLCRSCHMIKDGRLDRLHNSRIIDKKKVCGFCNKVFEYTHGNKRVRFCSYTCSNRSRKK